MLPFLRFRIRRQPDSVGADKSSEFRLFGYADLENMRNIRFNIRI